LVTLLERGKSDMVELDWNNDGERESEFMCWLKI
jgi:hypothetical protein